MQYTMSTEWKQKTIIISVVSEKVFTNPTHYDKISRDSSEPDKKHLQKVQLMVVDRV